MDFNINIAVSSKWLEGKASETVYLQFLCN
jgi:hypothetical protein